MQRHRLETFTVTAMQRGLEGRHLETDLENETGSTHWSLAPSHSSLAASTIERITRELDEAGRLQASHYLPMRTFLDQDSLYVYQEPNGCN
jgi:hypothetical protein